MRNVFRIQKITALIFTAVSIAVFVFSLSFMTEYKDLFGLKLKQNKPVSFFHDSVLQVFNRQIFVLALFGILIILFSFLLETYRRVPDRFALIVIITMLLLNCAGAVYAITNMQEIENYFGTLDFQYLELEGLNGYKPDFTTFRIGIPVYAVQIAASVSYGAAMAVSHITFIKEQKRKCAQNE
jgi:MFS superfamily sulfate permease-like transporter